MRDTGTPISSSRCEPIIRLPSRLSGTTSVAPAALRRARLASSMVRTLTGVSGRSSRAAEPTNAHMRVGAGRLGTKHVELPHARAGVAGHKALGEPAIEAHDQWR